ncbi:hypothetical protein CPHO_02940 [Corynebacterium phocae]|uniref:ABC transporter permease n=1 Tax=Corynebacterium phocae TaxID=161895 RepID=A0A1L7D1S4_9CORY|nr:hypothetical protein [Corynebacterium phocae]APT92023.1 hypothetical protein CPHO_02940 [Corynebacterium phocae]KAA8726404.1 hypothetical protein F4V58_02485 [Corynebacterium phocae]
MRKRLYLFLVPAFLVMAALCAALHKAPAGLAININPQVPGGRGQVLLSFDEMIPVFFITLATVVTFPTLSEWELRRRRPRVGKLLDSCFIVLAVCVSVGIDVFLFWRNWHGGPFFQYEILFNNTLLYAGIAFLAVTYLGRTKGAVVCLATYAFLILVLAYRPVEMDFYWPYASFNGPGPWYSPVHYTVTTIVLLAGLWARYHWAGAANSALNKDT